MKVKRGEVSQLYVDAQRDCDLCWNGSRAQMHLSQSIRLSSSSPGLSALVCSLSVHSFPPHSLLLRLVHPPTHSFSSPQHISPSRSALSRLFLSPFLFGIQHECMFCVYIHEEERRDDIIWDKRRWDKTTRGERVRGGERRRNKQDEVREEEMSTD